MPYHVWHWCTVGYEVGCGVAKTVATAHSAASANAIMCISAGAATGARRGGARAVVDVRPKNVALARKKAGRLDSNVAYDLPRGRAWRPTKKKRNAMSRILGLLLVLLALACALARAVDFDFAGEFARELKQTKKKPKTHVLRATMPPNTNGVTGFVEFEPSCLKDYTMVTVNMFGLNELAYLWNIYTVSGKLNQANLCANVGTRFVGPKGRQDGSISTRLGNWGCEDNIVNRIYLDNSTDVSGKYSIENKLLVVRRQTDGSAWLCAQILKV